MGATVHFIGITIYGIFASGELQPWAEPTPPYDTPLKPLDQETTFVSFFFLLFWFPSRIFELIVLGNT